MTRFANMKELRFDADDGVWRVAFAFDRKREAILLVAGDKSGVSE
ncbi:type II toxin-antitoxin system RelE/ParE family toxin [Mesorhizobium sp. M0047]